MARGDGAGQREREGVAAASGDDVDVRRAVTEERWELLRHITAAIASSFVWADREKDRPEDGTAERELARLQAEVVALRRALRASESGG